MNEITQIQSPVERGKIIAAIAAATGEIKPVAKDGKNTHDGYGFASIDGFLALVNPILARNGLVVMMDEAGMEDFTRKGKYGESAWMRVSFALTVYHTSGQTMPTVTRTVEVLRNGAQAYGSAQSYALKQFLRGLLAIPTGDQDDADLAPKDDGSIENVASRQSRPAPRPDPQSDQPAFSETDIFGVVARLNAAATIQALQEVWGHASTMQRDPRVAAAKEARKAALTASPKPAEDRWPGDVAQRPLVDDHIPY